ncbi:MAG TPA: Trk system potassium transporter TrkA [Nevskiaceae bacterium]|nr:Trk system potassium transporter TrkA [Nevskiaceae bacterium]
MKIVILGAGQVGATLAAQLASEHNDITVVDTDEQALAGLAEQADIRVIRGHGSHPDTLRRAGANDADLLIAVTDSDETNMLACRIAQTLFHTPTKVARVRAAEYLDAAAQLFGNDVLAIDRHISPEASVTEAVLRLIETPGALQVVDFAAGRVRLVGVRAYYGGPLVGHELRELPKHLPQGVEARVAAIYRRGRPILPQGDTLIEADDEVFFIAPRDHIPEIMAELRRRDRPVRRVMLVGGGNIGLRIARALENRLQVKVIEQNRGRARHIAEQLDHAVVLTGDGANETLLAEERIDDVDFFCAVTDDDEANILSSMLAKRLGASKVVALINRIAYVNLVEGGAIDIALSPQQATASALLALVRRGDVVQVWRLRHGAAEALEAIAQGTRETSKVVGRRLDELKLPPGTTIGAIVRGEDVHIAHHDTVISAGDHVILFSVDKHHADDVEALFQVAIGFV